MVAGEHDRLAVEPVELSCGPIDNRLPDSRRIEQVSRDQQPVDADLESQVDQPRERFLLGSECRGGTPALLRSEMHVGDVQQRQLAASEIRVTQDFSPISLRNPPSASTKPPGLSPWTLCPALMTVTQRAEGMR